MEIWKQINDFPNYEISNLGNVYSYKSNKILKPLLKKGYYNVCLFNKYGKRKWFSIHRLIAIYFIPNPDNLPTVDHIDRNPLNNNLNNLRWASLSTQNINRKNFNGGNISEKQRIGKNTYQYIYSINGKKFTKTFKSLFNAEIYRQMIKIKYLNK